MNWAAFFISLGAIGIVAAAAASISVLEGRMPAWKAWTLLAVSCLSLSLGLGLL